MRIDDINNIPRIIPFIKVSRSGSGLKKLPKTDDWLVVSKNRPINEARAYSKEDGITKIQDIKDKINSGYYSTEEFNKRLANKLIDNQSFLNHLGVRPVDSDSD